MKGFAARRGLQFGSDLREARDAASAWCRARQPG